MCDQKGKKLKQIHKNNSLEHSGILKRINIDVDKLNTYVIKKGKNKSKYTKITVLSIEVYQRGLTYICS